MASRASDVEFHSRIKRLMTEFNLPFMHDFADI
jgi:hypothetical protein